MVMIRSSNGIEAEIAGLVDTTAQGIPFRYDSADYEATSIIEQVFGCGLADSDMSIKKRRAAQAGSSFWKVPTNPGQKRTLHALKDAFDQEVGFNGKPRKEYTWRLGWLADTEDLEQVGQGWYVARPITVIDGVHVIWCSVPEGSKLWNMGKRAVAMRLWPSSFETRDGTGRWLAGVRGPSQYDKGAELISYRLFDTEYDAQEDFELTRAALNARAMAHSDAYLVWKMDREAEEQEFEDRQNGQNGFTLDESDW